MADPQKDAADALYELSIIADVMRAVATADISGGRRVCGTSVQWFSERMEVLHDRIEAALNRMGRA